MDDVLIIFTVSLDNLFLIACTIFYLFYLVLTSDIMSKLSECLKNCRLSRELLAANRLIPVINNFEINLSLRVC